MEGEILSLREISSYFNRNDFGIFAGVHLLPVNNKFGIDLRQTFSANLLFDKNEVDHFIKNDSMRSYFISLRFFYELNNIGDKKKRGGEDRRSRGKKKSCTGVHDNKFGLV